MGNKSSRAALFKRAYAPPGFSEGGIITRIINEGAERLGFDDERQLDITREAVDLTNQMVDAGLVDPQFRVKLRLPTSGEPSTRRNTGIEGDEEVFNAVNHALFSYHAGKSPLARAGSQAKEIYQGIRLAAAGKDSGSESLDYFNNMFGFDLARQGLSPDEAKSAIIDNIANIDNKGALSRLQAGEPLIAGKDLSRTAEDLRGGGPDVTAFDVLAGVQGLKDGGPPEKVPASVLEGRGNFYGTPYSEEPKVDTGQSNLTLQQRLDQATPLEQYAYEVLGLEPGLDRGMIAPVAIRQSGEKEAALPSLAYDSLKAMLAPGAALSGREVTPEETIELAMETMGTGAAMPGVDIGADVMAGMAAKPKGGVFMPMSKKENPLGPDFEDTGLASYFRDSGAETIPAFYADQLISSGMDEGLAMNIAGRIENYFKKSYGTGSDPIRIQMLEGKIDPIFTENITRELLKQAREDYAASKKGASRTTPALEKFESAYDRAAGIRAEANGKFLNEESFDYRRGLIERETERMTQEGVPRELQNQTYVMPLDPEEYAEAALDNPAIARALAESEPIYEIDPYRVSKDELRFILPEEMVDGIMSLPANKLENMSFPDIVANVQKTGVAKDVREVREFSKDFKEETRAINEASLEKIPPENIFNRTLPDSKFLLEKGVKKVDDFGKEGWFRITEPAYTELEGALMDHSVGGYSESGNYNLGGRKALASGRAGIFSLRNNKTGRPRLTVEIDFIDPDRPKPTTQIKGPSNSNINPSDYDKLYSLYDEVGVLIEDVPSYMQEGYKRYKEMGVSGMGDDFFV